MADGKIKISELDEALQLSDNAEFPYTQDNGGVPTTFKAPANQIARKVAEGSTFTNLETTAKTLVGAINELSHLGNPILLGTTAPTSSQGANGNIYVQYTEGTGDADDEVDGIFVKIDGAWCEISTGGGSGTTDYEDLSNKPQVNSIELVGNKSLDDLGIMPASLSKTVSGSIAHFTDGADNIPVKSLVSQIVAVQSGSGTPSPSNPRAISGFDSGVITRCGVNLWNEEWELGGISNVTGKNTESSTTIRSKSYIPIRENENVYFYNGGGYTVGLRFYDKNKTFIDTIGVQTSTVLTYGTANLPTNTKYIRFIVVSQTTYNNNISINYPSSDTQYHAYNGNTYTFTFGQTVYGGHFDNKGNLVVTHKVVDLSTLTWVEQGIGTGVYRATNFDSSNIDTPTGYIDTPDLIAEKYVTSNWGTIVDGHLTNAITVRNVGTALSPNIRLIVSNSTPSGKMIYKLITPTSLTITSQDIPTLFGENNIFSNCGDVEVNYYTDNADEIAGLIESAGGSGSGGHTIVDNEGVSLEQRTNLQFKGAYSEDNSTDDTTEIDVVREMTKAEFDELTEAEKTGLINITDITSGNDDRFQPVIYSEEEREIGVWTDGKPLYQKTVVSTDTLTFNTINQINLGITDIDVCVSVNGFASYGGNNSYVPLPYGDRANSNICITTITKSGIVNIYVGNDYTSPSIVNLVIITVRYTKTTDQAGSGQWTPQGVPAHHYSTDEQVVGTWINGKTLYEKTWYFQSSMVTIYRQWTSLNINVSDLDIEEIVDHRAQSYNSQSFSIDVWNDSGTLKAQYWNDGLNIGSVTIRYTKSST